MRLGYLGPAGSHSHAAIQQLCSSPIFNDTNCSLTQVPLASLSTLLPSLADGHLDLGCFPLENSLEGSVNEVLDWLIQTPNVQILLEFTRPISHALIRKYPHTEGIQVIHSHPQAIGQCRESLIAQLGPDVVFAPAASTSEAVKSLMQFDDSHAAIGTPAAAERYGMDVVLPTIAIPHENLTRFLVVGQADHPISLNVPHEAPRKTTISVDLPHNRAGSLLDFLTVLATHDLSMSKIESRPTKQALGQYWFLIDVDGPIPPTILAELRQAAHQLRFLGEYPVLGIL